MKASDLVVVTFQYKVIALRKVDGEKVWEVDLVTRFFKPADAFIALVIEENVVYAHAVNELFCLDLFSGRILWKKELGQRGFFTNVGIPSIAVAGATSAAISAQAASFTAIQRRKSDSGADGGGT